jgi:MFS family permease
VPVLKASAILIAIAMITFAIADSKNMLYLAATLFGLGNGIFSPAINAWTVDLGDPGRKAERWPPCTFRWKLPSAGEPWWLAGSQDTWPGCSILLQ